MRSSLIAVVVLHCLVALAADPVDVLMIGHYAPRQGERSWEKYQKACAREGVRVFINEQGRELDYEQFTLDYLKQFHVVLFGGLPGNPPAQGTNAAAAAFREHLHAYHEAGGGVLWVPLAFQQGATAWTALVGDRYGVRALEEALYDPGKTIDVNAPLRKRTMFQYIWTTNVADHPVTRGVEGLFLPERGEWSWPGTVPMVFGDGWTVLVRGMDSTRTMGNAAPPNSGKNAFKPEVPGTYEAVPELVGIRDFAGGGRMMIFPFHGTHTYLNFGHEAFKDAMMMNGHGGWPSDAHRLLLNACKWLAEPAVAAGFGGYQPEPPVTAAIPEPLDWNDAAFPRNSWGGMRTFWNQKTQRDHRMDDLFTPDGRDFRGFVGARTAAGNGQGSVADYVQAARDLDLSFVVFLEDLAQLDKDAYEQLAADCRAASDDDFAAIPGYIFRDRTGLLYYFFGEAVNTLPLAENLTADRRVKVPYGLVDQFRWQGSLGLAEFGAMKIDPNYLFLLTCAAPWVYEGSERVDDGLAGYLSVEGRGHQYSPVGLSLVDSPAAMTQAVTDGAPLTVLHAETLTDGLKVFTRRSPRHPTPCYITAGPTITRWGALNPIGHPFFAGKQRVRFALEATSEAGIATVEIVNANTGETLRRFRPDGARTFTCTVDETHRRQWSLVPIVTDVNGRQALGATLQTYQDGNRLWMMGDRLMGMHHAHTWDPTRTKLIMEGGWISSIPWTKNWANYPAGPPSALSQPRAGGGDVPITGKVVGIDGGNASSEGHVNFYFGPAAVSDQGREPKIKAYCFASRLASFDVAIMDFDGSRHFLEKKERGEAAWPPNPDPQVPMETVDIQTRVMAVRPSADAIISSNLHTVTFAFKQDLELKHLPLFSSAWQYQHENLMALFIGDRGGDLSWLLEPGSRFRRRGELAAGGYVYPANIHGGQLGVVNVGSEPLLYDFGYPRLQVFANGHDHRVQAGDRVVARFITFCGPKGDAATSNAWLRKFVADFGIDGEPPAYPFTVEQGKLRGTKYVLELASADGGAAVAFGQHDMAHNLLVAVNGIPANAVAGRYDLERRQLLILPVFEAQAITSVNLARGATRIYVGELLHCDNPAVRLSCAQDGADKLLLEVHNPTEQPQTAQLTAVPGFAPLAGLDRRVELAPCTSVKLALPTPTGSLVNEPYHGD